MRPETLARARQIISKMSMEEKRAQLVCWWPVNEKERAAFDTDYPYGAGSYACPKGLEDGYHFADRDLKRMLDRSPSHIPAVNHMEGLCGAMVRGAASFPSGIARGSTWDPELEREIGKLVGRQERAVGVTQTLAPVLDVTVDPRMGRYGESYGEDPTVAAAMGASYIKGMRGTSEEGKHTQCVAKHFLGYHAATAGVQSTAADIGPRRLREVFAKPFQAAITEAVLDGVMPCYNTINDEPVSGSKALLTKLLREEMGFEGSTWSDYSGIYNLYQFQKAAPSLTLAGKKALEAGMDVELPGQDCYNDEFLQMVKDGRIDRNAFEKAVERVICAKIEMGLFESPYSESEAAAQAAYSCPENEVLPRRAAHECLVLLKNDGALPLGNGIKKIALIGCQADDPRFLYGGYTFFSFLERKLAKRSAEIKGNSAAYVEAEVTTIPGTCIEKGGKELLEAYYDLKPDQKSIYKALKDTLPDTEISLSYGYPFAGNDRSHWDEALATAADADVVIVTLGGKYGMGTISKMGEGLDCTDIGLPECQEGFLKELKKLNKTVIGVHIDGRPLTSDAAEETCAALIEAWSPADFGGEAIADVLTGAYNPGGKLTVSVPRNAGQCPICYNHRQGMYWHQSYSIGFPDYVDCSHHPRYHFGHGLSYTTFEYADLSIAKTDIAPDGRVEGSFTLKNTGSVEGDEVVQLYITDEYASLPRPVQELVGFRRVHLAAGEQKTIRFDFPVTQLAFVDEDMRWKVEAGDFAFAIGSASDDIRLKTKFNVNADAFIDGRTRGFRAEVTEN